VDGTPNKKGTITHCTKGEMEINGRRSRLTFLVTGLGNESIILGLLWLQKVNPAIDWKKGTFEFREDLHLAQIQRIVEKIMECLAEKGPLRQPLKKSRRIDQNIPHH
jgi:hypothetical protein